MCGTRNIDVFKKKKKIKRKIDIHYYRRTYNRRRFFSPNPTHSTPTEESHLQLKKKKQ